MAQQTYSIVAKSGKLLQSGLFGHNVSSIAECIADERGEHVLIVGGPEDLREEVKPRRLRDELAEDARLLVRAEYDV